MAFSHSVSQPGLGLPELETQYCKIYSEVFLLPNCNVYWKLKTVYLNNSIQIFCTWATVTRSARAWHVITKQQKYTAVIAQNHNEVHTINSQYQLN